MSALTDRVYNLISHVERHPKMVKSLRQGVMTGIVHLAPADSSGREVCAMRSPGCTEACLNYSGFQYPKKQNARINRTNLYFDDRPAFMKLLADEISNFSKLARRKGFVPCIRLNGTSDIPWERVPCPVGGFLEARSIMMIFPDVLFMDYTKRANRKDLPPNYRLVFSRSEDNEDACLEAARNGMNIAVVFNVHKDKKLPAFWDIKGSDPLKSHRFRVIDGDEHDFRYGDYDEYPERVIIGLRAKGPKGRSDKTGFVINLEGDHHERRPPLQTKKRRYTRRAKPGRGAAVDAIQRQSDSFAGHEPVSPPKRTPASGDALHRQDGAGCSGSGEGSSGVAFEIRRRTPAKGTDRVAQGGGIVWTQEMIDAMRAVHHNTKSCRKTATIMTDRFDIRFTRNMIIAKMWREKTGRGK